MSHAMPGLQIGQQVAGSGIQKDVSDEVASEILLYPAWDLSMFVAPAFEQDVRPRPLADLLV
jgi:hypothetical protein